MQYFDGEILVLARGEIENCLIMLRELPGKTVGIVEKLESN
jgi:hypothetical protein